MNLNPETEKKVEELQFLEQNLNSLIMQKQTFQVEANEISNAITEVKASKDDIYKIVGEVMLKTEKEKTLKDLDEKKKIVDMRLNSIEKQEKFFEEKAEKLRKELTETISKKSK